MYLRVMHEKVAQIIFGESEHTLADLSLLLVMQYDLSVLIWRSVTTSP